MTQKRRLRNFLYLDSEAVDGAIAQLYGGLVDEMAHKAETTGALEGTGRVGFPAVGVGGKRTTSDTTSAEYKVLSIPEARFNSVMAGLESEDAVTEFSFFDPGTWDSLSGGEILLVTVTLKVFSLDRVFLQIDSLKGLGDLAANILPVAEALGLEGFEAMQGMAEMMKAIGSAAAASPVLSMIGRVRDSPQYQIVGRLKRTGIRGDALMLEQECQLVGFLDRRTSRKGETITVSPTVPDFASQQTTKPSRGRGPAQVPAGSRHHPNQKHLRKSERMLTRSTPLPS